jgi:hypothetical protein
MNMGKAWDPAQTRKFATAYEAGATIRPFRASGRPSLAAHSHLRLFGGAHQEGALQRFNAVHAPARFTVAITWSSVRQVVV